MCRRNRTMGSSPNRRNKNSNSNNNNNSTNNTNTAANSQQPPASAFASTASVSTVPAANTSTITTAATATNAASNDPNQQQEQQQQPSMKSNVRIVSCFVLALLIFGALSVVFMTPLIPFKRMNSVMTVKMITTMTIVIVRHGITMHSPIPSLISAHSPSSSSSPHSTPSYAPTARKHSTPIPKPHEVKSHPIPI